MSRYFHKDKKNAAFDQGGGSENADFMAQGFAYAKDALSDNVTWAVNSGKCFRCVHGKHEKPNFPEYNVILSVLFNVFTDIWNTL